MLGKERAIRIAVVAPACPIDAEVADRVTARAAALYGGDVALAFHPQCFLTAGHFAGDDAARLAALVEVGNDPAIDAVWFARGGYGSARIVEPALAALGPNARNKAWLGYSDLGTLLGALHARGFGNIAHGPMAADIRRTGGEAAIDRALGWLIERDPAALEPGLAGRPSIAFNLTILSTLIGTFWEPDLGGLDLLVEEVGEHHYRVDRLFAHVTAGANVRRAAGMRLGRISEIAANDRAFGHEVEEIAAHWCAVAGIPLLASADIGHDAANRVVPFGRAAARNPAGGEARPRSRPALGGAPL